MRVNSLAGQLGVGFVVLVVLLLAIGVFVLRPIIAEHLVLSEDDYQDGSFSHASFETLLTKYVRGGRVDYQRWHDDKEDRQIFDEYLATIAAFSPENSPERFSEDNDEVAYWMYSYNAFVIDAILDRWPLESVVDVKAPIELVKGLGFFYTLKFTAGGQLLSLYEIEHKKVLEKSGDPRVHFVLNCGSGGCPVIRPRLPTGKELNLLLSEATQDFISDPTKVRIDHNSKTLHLSTIFKWYKDDFMAQVRREGRSARNGLIEYLLLVADHEQILELQQAITYQVRFMEYDWGTNSTSGSDDTESPNVP